MATLRLHIKQHIPIQKSTGLQGYYQGLNPNNLTFTPGTLPSVRQWPNYGSYIDVTQYADDIHKLKLTWTEERDDDGNLTVEDGRATKKSSSGDISLEGYAFDLVKKWLIDDVAAALNCVEVMIEDVGCGRYVNWQITAEDINFCENEICVFEVNLKQYEDPLACIHRTVINDDWQGWFHSGITNKKHPRFSYCNEIRPNGGFVALWTLMLILFFAYDVIMIPLTVISNLIIIAINALIGVIKLIIAFINALGANITGPDFIKLNDPFDVLNGQADLFIESAGCGREHPAPLVRDYISNVCSKCGVVVNEQTAPVFFANSITLETSNPNRGTLTFDNPHYNACYLNADRKRGIRRFKSIDIFGSALNLRDYYIPENAPDLALDQFLEKLKTLYNFEWQVKTVNVSGQLKPHLYINRKDDYRNAANSYVYDFSERGADRHKIIEGICYEWNGKQSPVYASGIYQNDGADTCGNEALPFMNDIISFGSVDNNPGFKGHRDIQADFGATKFRLDGASTDYLADALQALLNRSVNQLFLAPIWSKIISAIEQYADYALLMKDETCGLPKVLIWDGNSYENAKCARVKQATDYGNGFMPEINPKYNHDAHTWDARHPAETEVLMSPASPNGLYRVSGFLGVFHYEKIALLPNYPMYFAQDFYDSLWDWFHWVDDPTRGNLIKQNFRLKIELCCDDLKNRLNVFNDAGGIKLGGKVKLPAGRDGVITEITASYDPTDEKGQYIEIKGKL